MCARAVPSEWHHRFFKAYIFGHCLKRKQPELFAIHPVLSFNKFEMVVERIIAVPKMYYPMGSGTEKFVEAHRQNFAVNPDVGVFQTLQKMVKADIDPTVGGHTQVAVVTPSGVELRPLLILGDKPYSGHTTFLGVEADTLGGVGGFTIGYYAVGPDPQEMAAHASELLKKGLGPPA
jgi:hypothetical protein